jgi:hypothetical protein
LLQTKPKAMPENKYCYVITDPNGNTLGAATTMKKALAMLNTLTLDDVEVIYKHQETPHIQICELSSEWYITKITLNQI